MSASLAGVDAKLARAVAHIHGLQRQITDFTDLRPYTARVQEGVQDGERVGRLVAIHNRAVQPPDVGMVLLAGEALYQFRSALDHLIHQLVILAGNATRLSRRHQFPIFDTRSSYLERAYGRIDGVSADVADVIERAQPYNRTAYEPQADALWILQDLNNTDKHRLVPITTIGIGEVRGRDKRGDLFTMISPDIVLEDNKVFWTFTTPERRYDDISAEITCALAFEQAMHVGVSTVSLDTMLWHIMGRVHEVVNLFRPLF